MCLWSHFLPIQQSMFLFSKDEIPSQIARVTTTASFTLLRPPQKRWEQVTGGSNLLIADEMRPGSTAWDLPLYHGLLFVQSTQSTAACPKGCCSKAASACGHFPNFG